MSLKKWLGWETMISFSMFGGSLRVLPIQKEYLWSVVITTYVVGLLWLLIILINEPRFRLKNRHKTFYFIFLVLLIWCIISLYWSPFLPEKLVTNDFYIMYNALIPMVALVLSKSSGIVLQTRWLSGIILSAFIMSSYAFIIWIESVESLYSTLIVLSEDSIGDIYLGVAQSLMILSVSSFFWGIYASTWNKTAIIICAVSFGLALDTGGRGPIIWGVLTMLIGIISSKYNKRKEKFNTLMIYLVICSILLGLYLINSNDIFSLINSPFFNRLTSDANRDYDALSSIGMRLISFEQAFSLFVDSPLIGQGALAFRSLSEFGQIYPHNFILDILGDLGLVGLFLVICLGYFGITSAWNGIANGEHVIQKICPLLFIYFLLLELSSGYFYWSLIWPWIIVLLKDENRSSKNLNNSCKRSKEFINK